MQSLRDQIKQADERETAQKESMAAEEQTVVEMSKQIATMNQEIGNLNDTIQKADTAKTDHLKAVADLEQENEKQYETFDQEKTDLKAQLNQAQQQHEEEAVKLKDQLAESQQQIVNNKDVFEERENAISELQGVLAARNLRALPSRMHPVLDPQPRHLRPAVPGYLRSPLVFNCHPCSSQSIPIWFSPGHSLFCGIDQSSSTVWCLFHSVCICVSASHLVVSSPCKVISLLPSI